MLLRRSIAEDLRRFRRLRAALVARGWSAEAAEATARDAVHSARALIRREWCNSNAGYLARLVGPSEAAQCAHMRAAYRKAARIASVKHYAGR